MIIASNCDRIGAVPRDPSQLSSASMKWPRRPHPVCFRSGMTIFATWTIPATSIIIFQDLHLFTMIWNIFLFFHQYFPLRLLRPVLGLNKIIKNDILWSKDDTYSKTSVFHYSVIPQISMYTSIPVFTNKVHSYSCMKRTVLMWHVK